jgi:hypothetical protein
MKAWRLCMICAVGVAALMFATSASALGVTWMKGYPAPDTGQIRQGRGAQARPAERQERARAGAGNVFRVGLFRAARQLADLKVARVAGVVRGAPREPARGSIRDQPRQAGKGPARSRCSTTTSAIC